MTGVIVFGLISALLIVETRHQARLHATVRIITGLTYSGMFRVGDTIKVGGVSHAFVITEMASDGWMMRPCGKRRLRILWGQRRRVWWKILDAFDAAFPSIAARIDEKW